MKRKGQAMIEFVLCVGFFIPILSGLLVFSRTVLVRRQALSAARLGTWLQSSGLATEATVRQEVAGYGANYQTSGGAPWQVELGRFRGTPASRFYTLVWTNIRVGFHSAFLRRLGLENRFQVEERVVVQKVRLN